MTPIPQTLKLPLDPDATLRTELRAAHASVLAAIAVLTEAHASALAAASQHERAAQRFDDAAQRLTAHAISIRTGRVGVMNVYNQALPSTMAAVEADQLAADLKAYVGRTVAN